MWCNLLPPSLLTPHTPRQASQREAEAAAKAQLEEKIRSMQAKLIQGGAVLDEASKEKAELWRKQAALKQELEEQKRAEAQRQREMEEANLMIEEKYNSLQEEVDATRRKLKKVWAKLKSARKEIEDLTVRPVIGP